MTEFQKISTTTFHTTQKEIFEKFLACTLRDSNSSMQILVKLMCSLVIPN